MFDIPAVESRTREDFSQYSCRLTLDPNTACRDLRLSEGNREYELAWLSLAKSGRNCLARRGGVTQGALLRDAAGAMEIDGSWT
ncbi:hypothetical protein AGOR_G00171730 [Albula goreensis]|uniref:Uncharacterized protein n=1 Tax=Albula goreensis TaxID=1534307 RepID=A0A8T3CTR5_9TELE|nr:hypothetical protein AGOR_G00171730 [Albula goreensis]